MADQLAQEIRGLVLGDEWIFYRSYKGAPAGTNVTGVKITFKTSDQSPSVAAQSSITGSPSTSGQITQNGAAGTVEFTIKVPANVTGGLSAQPYAYDIELTYATGGPFTPEKGTAFPVRGVTN